MAQCLGSRVSDSRGSDLEMVLARDLIVSVADQKQGHRVDSLGTGVTWRVKARPASFGGDLPGAGRSNGGECNAPVLFLKYDSKIADRRMVIGFQSTDSWYLICDFINGDTRFGAWRFGKSGVSAQSSLLDHQSGRLDDMHLVDPVTWIDGLVDWMSCLGSFYLDSVAWTTNSGDWIMAVRGS
uniref:Uncharacterized protein n=1 Tax=Fagus sylvatica TaxID=28930 RepID=A0A2N9HKP4_FAGSY